MALDAGSSSGGGGKQKVVKGTKFSPSTNSSGNYTSSGGGAPSSPPSSYSAPTSYGYSAPSYNPPSKSYSSSLGSGGGGGGGAPKQKPKPKPPPPPSIKEYLGTDEQYQRDRASLLKNFRNLRAATRENRGNVKLDKRTTLKRLNEEQAENYQEMVDDFAARGLYGGAEFLKKENDFNLDYLEQKSDTRQSASRNIQQLLRDLRSAKTLRNENLSQARLEAIRRRAAKYGIKE